MKEVWNKFLDNPSAFLWFSLGIMYIALAIARMIEGNGDRAMAFCAAAFACQAKCETRILDERIDKIEKHVKD